MTLFIILLMNGLDQFSGQRSRRTKRSHAPQQAQQMVMSPDGAIYQPVQPSYYQPTYTQPISTPTFTPPQVNTYMMTQDTELTMRYNQVVSENNALKAEVENQRKQLQKLEEMMFTIYSKFDVIEQYRAKTASAVPTAPVQQQPSQPKGAKQRIF